MSGEQGALLAPDPARFPVLVSVKEAAAILGVKPTAVYASVARGRLPCVRIGVRTIRFNSEALHAYMAAPKPDLDSTLRTFRRLFADLAGLRAEVAALRSELAALKVQP